MSERFDIKAILADPAKRREMAIRVIMSCQTLEGIPTTREQAERAYDKVLAERESGDIGHREPFEYIRALRERGPQLPDIDLDDGHAQALATRAEEQLTDLDEASTCSCDQRGRNVSCPRCKP